MEISSKIDKSLLLCTLSNIGMTVVIISTGLIVNGMPLLCTQNMIVFKLYLKHYKILHL